MAQLVLKNILAGSGNVLAGGDNSGNVNKVTIGSNLTLTSGVLSATGGGSGSVTSVAVTESGDSLVITGSPITTSGTINIGFAGTGAQYIKGDGTLATFPTTISQAQRLITEVYNSTGATLSKGTVVYINGGQGNLPTVTKALATSDATSAQTYGVVQSDITNMNNGFVVVIGSLIDLDTQAYAVGTQLYLSGTTAGTWTSTKPQAPIHLVYVAIVVRSHPTQGVVEVKVQNGVEMDEIHDVQITSIANGNILQYDSATSLWKNVAGTTTNIAEGTNLYFTNARARGVLSTNVGSALSYNSSTGRFTLEAAESGIDGYLTGTDWDYFDSKQASLGTGTTSQFLRGDLVWAAPAPISLDDLTDVAITSPTNGQLLRWQIDHWENWTLPSYVQTTRTLTINGTGYDLSANRTWSVGTITALTGEATASGTGSVAITLTNSAVIGKVLTGLNVTGGSIAATDSILTAFGKAQNQINGLIGGSIYKGTWNASTNTPALASSVGTAGWYYIVSVAGTTNLNGITDWQLGDWAIFNGGVWQKVDNTDSVVSVNGFTGAVSLTTDNISEGATNLYYTNTRARLALSANPGSALTYNSSTGRFTLEEAATGVSGYVTGADYDYWTAKQASLGTGTVSQYLRGDLVWANPPAPALEDLTDVTITTPANGQLLRYQAGIWINFTPTYISLTALSATAPLSYNNTTGVFSISLATTSANGYLSSTDWNTFNNKQPLITAGTTSQYYRGDKTFQTLNTTAVTEGTNLYFTTARVLATALTGYAVGTNTALAATDTILGAFGKVQAQINSKGSGTVTSVAALTLGTSGTDLSSTVATGTTTPVITLNVPTASAANRGALSSADWSTFNGKQNAITLTTTGTSGAATLVGATLNIPQYQAAGTYVTSVTATSPIASTGGTTPVVSISQATTSTDGYLSSTDWNTFNNKQDALTNPVTGSGAANYVAKWNTSSAITNSLIYDNGTQVGVNTTNMASLFDVTKNALGTTVVDTSGITLKNETAALVGVQQISPALHFSSNGWGTGLVASLSTEWIMYNLPIQGTTPTVNLIFASSVNNAAYTTRATLTSAGALTITGGLSATTGAFSSTLSAVTTATLTRNAIATTSSDGVIVQNTTAALVGVQVQMSPRIRLSGTAWNTGTSATNTTNWVIENLPAANNPPTSTLRFAYFDTVNATLTNKFTLTNAGAATFTGAISASNLSGTNTGDQTITLSGDVTGTGTSAITASISAATVTGKVLTGYAVGANTAIAATDTILAAFGKTQAQINAKGSGTVTSVAALTLGTTGTDVSSSVATGTTTPVITLNIPDASATARGLITTGTQTIAGAKTFSSTLTANGVSIGASDIRSSSNVLTLGGTSEVIRIVGSTGNVGIGTTAPNMRISVVGSGSYTIGTIDVAEFVDQIGTSAKRGVILGYYANGTSATAGTIRVPNNSDLLINPSGGNVGIGTSSPSNILELGGATNKDMGIVSTSQTSYVSVYDQGMWLACNRKTTTGAFSNTSLSSAAIWLNGASGGSSIWFRTAAANNTAPDDRMVITSAGNVGINITPHSASALEVKGLSASSLVFQVRASDANNSIYLSPNNSGYNRISGNYMTSAPYLPLSLTAREDNSDLVLLANGNILIGTTTDAGYKLEVNGQVRATAFFESSDKRLKKEISENPSIDGISQIKPKLYIKDGKEELGYYAQDLEQVLPSSVSEGKDGFLALSYTQVHTAKIAQLESKIEQLEKLIYELGRNK